MLGHTFNYDNPRHAFFIQGALLDHDILTTDFVAFT